jgi:hypothetical protein
VAVPVSPIGAQEWLKVELVDHVAHEPGQMVGWQPVAQVRREQEGLVAVAAQEVGGHDAYYRFVTFIPNANCFLSVNSVLPSACLLPASRQPGRPRSARPGKV